MTAWGTFRGELAVTTSHDFERLILPYARLVWGNLVRVPLLREYDRAGIDIARFDARNGLVVAIQCKGFFSTRELTENHSDQIIASIDSFSGSTLCCEDYIVIHNRSGADRVLAHAIQDKLRGLIVRGKAKRAILLDRFAFTKLVRSALESLIVRRLSEESAQLLDRTSRLFRFGDVYLPEVPFSKFQLEVRRYQPPLLSRVQETGRGPISEIVLSNGPIRWTLLVGLFGSGKSTAALRAAIGKAKTVVLVPCADLPFGEGFGGTNALLAQVIIALGLFDDFEDEDKDRLQRLAGPLLRIILSRQNGDTALILDGLDENRAFSTPGGITRLTNALRELRSPMVLVTRQEHFDATFGNFGQLLGDASEFETAKTRSALLYKLEPWSRIEVAEFLEACSASNLAPNRVPLQELAAAMRKETETAWPVELLTHPLFLQMIAELASENVDGASDRAAMLQQWIVQKITRDLSVERELPASTSNVAVFADQIMTVMQEAAGHMIELVDGRYSLIETVRSDVVEKIAAEVFKSTAIDIANLVNVSLLVPTSSRLRAVVPIRFSHRVFQEYFVARYLISAGLSNEQFPEPVAELAQELRAAQVC